MGKGNRTVAALVLSVIFFAGLTGVDGACTIPSSIHNSYWTGYSASDEVIVMAFSTTNVMRKNLATGQTIDNYDCEDILETSPYVLVLMKDATTQYCLDLAAEKNVILSRTKPTTSSFTAAGQCRDLFDNTQDPFNVMVQYDETANDFVIDQASCPGDLIIADYTLTYSETTGTEVCTGDATSTGTIGTQTNVITVFSCTNIATYYQPFRTSFSCLATYRNNIVGQAGGDNSDVLILSATFGGKQRFYCSYYRVDYGAWAILFSIEARDDKFSQCVHGGTADHAEALPDNPNAGHKAFKFISQQCTALEPCLHGGTCTQKIGTYECACVDGYEGMNCETDIDECASTPCQNEGICNDAVAGYECRCKDGFIGTHCETAICIFPTTIRKTWAAGYNMAYTSYNTLIFEKFQVTIPDDSDKYYCVYDSTEGDVTYVSASVNPYASGKHICLQYTVIEINNQPRFVLSKIATPAVSQATSLSIAACKAKLDMVTTPELAYPVNAADTVDPTWVNCPFTAARYQATIMENGPLTSCDDNETSVATTDMTSLLDINSCEDDNTFEKPWKTQLRCAGTISASTVDPSGNVGDEILILGYTETMSNGHSFYCARYKMFDQGYHISLPIDDPFSSPCHPGQKADDVSATESAITMSSHECYTGTSEARCLNGGTCMDNGFLTFRCMCVPGYIGTRCETDINECSSSPCKNGGTCVDLVNKYECMCVSGWTGTNCEQESLECASEPCLNGGTCLERTNGYYCRCTEGWIWQHCEHPNNCENRICLNDGTCEDDLEFATCSCAPGWSGPFCETYDEASQPTELSEDLDTPSIILICLFTICGFAALLMIIIVVLCRSK